MAGPLDIYEQPFEQSSNFISSTINSPIGFVGWIGAEVGASSLSKRFTKRVGSPFGAFGTRASQTSLASALLHGKVHPNRLGMAVTGTHFNPLARHFGWGAQSTRETAAVARWVHRRAGAPAVAQFHGARGLMGVSRFLGAFMAIEIGAVLGNVLSEAIRNYQYPTRKISRRELETGGAFVDTRSAQSQRARAIQAIHNSQMSTRALLTNEAAFLHLSR